MERHILQSLNLSSESNTAELISTTVWEWTSILEISSLSTVAILGVFMSLFVFVLYRNKSTLRTSANTFVLSLSTSAILRSIFLLPLSILFLKKWTPGRVWCRSFSFLNLCFNIASVLSLLLIACDRYSSVKDPLHYVRINSKCRARILVICIWLLSLSMGVPIILGFPVLDYETCDIKVSPTRSIFDPSVIYEATIIITSFILPFFFVTCLYYGIYRRAKKNIARGERYSCSSCGSSDVVVNIKSICSSEGSEYHLRRHIILDGENSQKKNRFLRKNRAEVTVLLIAVSFVIFWSPYFIIRFYQLFKVVTIQVKFMAQFLTFLSIIVDSYVYFYRNHSTWSYTKNLASRTFQRMRALMYLPNNITNSIDTISNLYHTSASLSQTLIQ